RVSRRSLLGRSSATGTRDNAIRGILPEAMTRRCSPPCPLPSLRPLCPTRAHDTRAGGCLPSAGVSVFSDGHGACGARVVRSLRLHVSLRASKHLKGLSF